jgi:hypothetical protein
LNLFNLFNDVVSNLLSPSLAFIKIVYLSNVADSLRPLIVLSIDESPLHGPPSI